MESSADSTSSEDTKEPEMVQINPGVDNDGSYEELADSLTDLKFETVEEIKTWVIKTFDPDVKIRIKDRFRKTGAHCGEIKRFEVYCSHEKCRKKDIAPTAPCKFGIYFSRTLERPDFFVALKRPTLRHNDHVIARRFANDNVVTREIIYLHLAEIKEMAAAHIADGHYPHDLVKECQAKLFEGQTLAETAKVYITNIFRGLTKNKDSPRTSTGLADHKRKLVIGDDAEADAEAAVAAIEAVVAKRSNVAIPLPASPSSTSTTSSSASPLHLPAAAQS